MNHLFTTQIQATGGKMFTRIFFFVSLQITIATECPIHQAPHVRSQLGNYNSFEGVLYCRPHFDQLFKKTGSLDKSFEGNPKVTRIEKPIAAEGGNSAKVSSMFVGTKDKCVGCQKTAYPTERVTVDGTAYHRSCFKCCHGGCTISPSNYMSHEGKLYCKHHHNQLFKEKGNYSQLENEGASAAAGP